jgi:hypothetical protein
MSVKVFDNKSCRIHYHNDDLDNDSEDDILAMTWTMIVKTTSTKKMRASSSSSAVSMYFHMKVMKHFQNYE